jgi:hypothetical protein
MPLRSSGARGAGCSAFGAASGRRTTKSAPLPWPALRVGSASIQSSSREVERRGGESRDDGQPIQHEQRRLALADHGLDEPEQAGQAVLLDLAVAAHEVDRVRDEGLGEEAHRPQVVDHPAVRVREHRQVHDAVSSGRVRERHLAREHRLPGSRRADDEVHPSPEVAAEQHVVEPGTPVAKRSRPLRSRDSPDIPPR